jgi:general secretion pathway protein M
MIKIWWQNLSLRDQQLLIISSAILLPVLLFFLVLSPLSNSVTDLKQQVISQRKLVDWMQVETSQIKKFPNANEQSSQTITPDNFANIILLSLQAKDLKQYLQSTIDLNSTTMKTIKFKTVPFDSLIDWITLLWQQDQIKTSRLNISTDHVNGLVAADVTVSLSSKN